MKKDGSKKPKWRLGVTESKLGSAIQETTGIPCQSNEFTGEVLRGVRMHLPRFLKQLEETDITKVCSHRCCLLLTAECILLHVLIAVAWQPLTLDEPG